MLRVSDRIVDEADQCFVPDDDPAGQVDDRLVDRAQAVAGDRRAEQARPVDGDGRRAERHSDQHGLDGAANGVDKLGRYGDQAMIFAGMLSDGGEDLVLGVTYEPGVATRNDITTSERLHQQDLS